MRPPGHTGLRSVPHSRPAGGQRSCLASLDASLTVVAADAGFLRQYGSTSAQMCGRSIHDLLLPGASPALDHHLARLADGRAPYFTERVVGTRGADEVFTAELTGIAVYGVATSVVCTVVLRPDEEQLLPRGADREELSPLGARILEGVACGASTVQLATRLYLSRQGVEYHVHQMLRQLRVPNRAALVARAHSQGMFAPGVWPPRILPGFVREPGRRTPVDARRTS